MSNILATHSVDFSGQNVHFDVVALSDISGTMSQTFSFKDIFYQKGFQQSDSSAVAIIDVSAADYNDLFKINVPIYDPSTGYIDVDNVRYLTKSNGWSDVSFSNAVVFENPIFSSHTDQTIKRDYLRSMLKDITGTTRLNNLFKNRQSMVNHISSLDASFNAEIKSILNLIGSAGWLTDSDYGSLVDSSQGYTFQGIFQDYSTDPSDLTVEQSGHADLSNNTQFSKFNPLRILSSSILGDEDVDFDDLSSGGLENSSRRDILIGDISNQVNNFWNDISNTEYEGIDTNGDKYRVWLYESAAAAGAIEENGVKFSKYLDGFKVYTIDDVSNGENLITEVVDKEYNFNFISGDRLHLLIEYKPFESSFSSISSNPSVNSRIYEPILNMT